MIAVIVVAQYILFYFLNRWLLKKKRGDDLGWDEILFIAQWSMFSILGFIIVLIDAFEDEIKNTKPPRFLR